MKTFNNKSQSSGRGQERGSFNYSKSASVLNSIYSAKGHIKNEGSNRIDLEQKILFPIITETNRKLRGGGLVSLVYLILIYLQLMFSSIFDRFEGESSSFPLWLQRILFIGVTGPSSEYNHQIVFTIITAINVLIFVLFVLVLLDMVVNIEMKRVSIIIFKYFIGYPSMYMCIPNARFFFSAFGEYAYSGEIINVVWTAIAFLTCVFVFYVVSGVTVPILLNPYITVNNCFTWRAQVFITNTVLTSAAIGFYQFLRHFEHWYRLVSIASFILITPVWFNYGWSMQCNLFEVSASHCGLSITLFTGGLISFCIHSGLSIPEYICFTSIFAVYVVSFLIFYIFMRIKSKNLGFLLSYRALNGLPLLEQVRIDHLDQLSLINDQRALQFLFSGLRNGSDLFLDMSLIKFLSSRFSDNNTVMMYCTWFVSFFPGEQTLANSLFNLLSSMVEPSYFERVMYFQLHRIHILRQSSASDEVNADFKNIRSLTDAMIYHNCHFWQDAASKKLKVSIDFFIKATNIKDAAESRWNDLLDKYPNNSSFASEYSRYLLDGLCRYKEAIIWHQKSQQLELNKKHQVDRMFQRFVITYPFYLKKGLVDRKGCIRIDKTPKNNLAPSYKSLLNSESRNSSVSSTISSGTSDDDDDCDSDDIDIDEAEKFLKKSSLRLVYETAVNSIESPVLNKAKIITFIRIAVILVYLAILMGLLYPIFDRWSKYLDCLSHLNDFQHILCVLAPQVFHSIAYEQADYEANLSYFTDLVGNAPNLVSFLNYTQSPPGVLYNLSIMCLNRIDDLSASLFKAYQQYDLISDLNSLFSRDRIDMFNCIPANESLNGYFDIIPSYSETTLDVMSRNLLNSFISMSDTKNVPSVLGSPYLCISYLSYFQLQKQFNLFNLSSLTSTSTTTSIDSTFFSSFDMFNSDSYYEYNLTNFLIMFSPFIVLLISMPSLILLSSGVEAELEEFSIILTDFSPETCLLASEPFMDVVSGNNKRVISSKYNSRTIRPWFFSFCICICVIAVFLAIVILTKLRFSQILSRIQYYSNYMELRNNLYELGFSVLGQILLQNIVYGNVSGFTHLPTYMMQDESTIALTGVNLSQIVENKITKITDIMNSLAINQQASPTDDISKIRFDQQCSSQTDTGNSVVYIECMSLDRVISYFIGLCQSVSLILSDATELVVPLISEKSLLISLIMSSRLACDFETITSSLKDDSSNIIYYIHTSLLSLFGLSLILVLVLFFMDKFVLRKVEALYSILKTLILRVPPTLFNANHAAINLFLTKLSVSDLKIVSASHAIFQTSSDAMILLNDEQIIEKINPAAQKIFGYTPEQMLGQKLQALIDKSVVNNVQLYNSLDLMKSGQSSLVFESNVIGHKDDGNEIPLKATLLGFSSNGRNAEYYAIMCMDLTEALKQKQLVESAKKQSEDLLLKILPPDIIKRLNRGEKDITMVIPSATIIFIDIVQFSAYMSTLSPSQLMANLGAVFTAYDKIIATMPMITKIKLIGDDYMAAAGLFNPDDPPKEHAIQMIQFAIQALAAIDYLNEQLNADLQVRIGINTNGPLIAGVLGTDRPLFDIIGDPINVASRLQTTDVPGLIQISQATYDLVAGESMFRIEERGEIFLKGKGNQLTYLVYPPENNVFMFKDQMELFHADEVV